ncbi:PTS glucitol/sorbitol transporter subunit IIA [Nonomuraea sp. 10N515B]|uniref:PTS glucitol/sorbitol transporter subunit IIA n=1 Tax=Nonomuraea sp. 10N515B TaxID=3457422 RepID=UPI003FCC9CFB
MDAVPTRPAPNGSSPAAVRYASQVTAVGPMVPDFAEQRILVFFGGNAPAELHDFCVLHSATVATGGLRVGDEIVIDDTVLSVLALGEVAEENLLNLGHLNLKANGETRAPLPGDVCVEDGPLPVPRPGSRFWIREAAGRR